MEAVIGLIAVAVLFYVLIKFMPKEYRQNDDESPGKNENLTHDTTDKSTDNINHKHKPILDSVKPNQPNTNKFSPKGCYITLLVVFLTFIIIALIFRGSNNSEIGPPSSSFANDYKIEIVRVTDSSIPACDRFEIIVMAFQDLTSDDIYNIAHDLLYRYKSRYSCNGYICIRFISSIYDRYFIDSEYYRFDQIATAFYVTPGYEYYAQAYILYPDNPKIKNNVILGFELRQGSYLILKSEANQIPNFTNH